MEKKLFSTKTLVLAALCIALSTVLSYFKIWEMPQGGSVTLASMLPLLLLAFVCGPTVGIIAGLVHGILQLILGGYVVHPVQLLLDYPLAFACLGLCGILPGTLKNIYVRFSLGAALAILSRGFMSTLSGVVFFSEYAGDMNPWLYSLIYNYSFLSVELLITLVIGCLLLATPVYSTLKNQFA